MPQRLLSDTLLEHIVTISREAGVVIAQYFTTDYEVETKSDHSPLTSADLAAHEIITHQIAELSPKVPILSEESAKIRYADRQKWQTYWLIDPLDGTREFIKGIPEFTVNIALIHEHQPVLGVIHIPMQNITYMAMQADVATKELPDGSHERISTRALSGHLPVVCGSRSHGGKSLKAFLQRLGDHRLLAKGSSIKSCLIAEGSADVYPRFGPTSEWDTAASQCIVEAAGGQIVDMEFNPLRYNTKDSLLNPHFMVFGDRTADWAQYIQQ